ncbi:hypothetical protein AB0J77_14675 [Micromonospora tulbaghiae]|uniref:hypothetical protein n=1 Tax=Micromonospora tulbaghiae TaxID=479978 RepID=UPI003419D681
MATRLYYVASTVPPQSPPFDAGWSSTASAVRRRLAAAQASATESLSGSVANTSTALVVQLVSPPLAAQTISGSFTLVSRGRELDPADNVNQRWRSVRVFSGDGSTLRGTLNSYGVTGSTTEFAASLAGQPHAVNGSLSPVVCQDGDVLVVEVGYGLSGTGTTPQWEMVLGGTGADHTTSINDASGSVPWVEFSADLVFQLPVVSGLGEAVFSFGADASGVRVVDGSAAAAFGFGAAAAGIPLVAGAAAAVLAFGALAAGVRVVPGAGGAAVPLAASASGVRVVGGSGGLPLSWSASASGVRVVPGAAVASLAFAAGLPGVRVVPGSAGAPVGFSAAVVGTVVPGPGTVAGVAVAVLGFTAAGAGVRLVPGGAAAVLDFDAAGAGVAVVSGVAAADLGFTAAAVGSSHVPGQRVPRPYAGVVARLASVVSRPSAGVVVRP